MARRGRRVLRALRRAGWRVEVGSHVKAYCPCGDHLVVMGASESDVRAVRNTVARLRRAGDCCPEALR